MKSKRIRFVLLATIFCSLFTSIVPNLQVVSAQSTPVPIQTLSYPDLTIWHVYSDNIVKTDYAKSIQGMKEAGVVQIMLNHQSFTPEAPIAPKLLQFIADCRANGIKVLGHIDANNLGSAPHDTELNKFIAKLKECQVEGIYADGCEAIRFARNQTEPDAYIKHLKNTSQYVELLKNELGLTGKRAVVMASAWHYCPQMVTRVGTLDPSNRTSLSDQVREMDRNVDGLAVAYPTSLPKTRDYGWISPAISLDTPMPSFPREEYVQVFMAAFRRDAHVNIQATLEWFARSDIEHTQIRSDIKSCEAYRAKQMKWGTSSMKIPVISPPVQPPVVQPPIVPPSSASDQILPGDISFKNVPAWATVNAPADPVNWNVPIVNYYYVDPNNPIASDIKNGSPTNGIPTSPRKTIPQNVTSTNAPVKIKLNGEYSLAAAALRGGAIYFDFVGTERNPIFVDLGNAVFKRPLVITGKWIYVIGDLKKQNFKLQSTGPESAIVLRGSNIVLKHCDVSGGPAATTSAVSVGGLNDSSTAYNIVIYENLIHNNGSPPETWATVGDQDHHGIGVGSYVNGVWITKNEIHTNSGDGIQINAGILSLLEKTRNIFVTNNNCHDNKQTGAWSKAANNVWFVNNQVSGSKGSSSNPDGAGLGTQYGAKNVTFENNSTNDCKTGIMVASRSGPGGNGPGTNIRILNNTITNALVGLRIMQDSVPVRASGNIFNSVVTNVSVMTGASVIP